MQSMLFIRALLIAPFFAVSVAACHGDRVKAPPPGDDPAILPIAPAAITLDRQGAHLYATMIMAPQPGLGMDVEMESALHMLAGLLDGEGLSYEDVITLHVYVRGIPTPMDTQTLAHAYYRTAGHTLDVGPRLRIIGVSELPLAEARVALDAVIQAPEPANPA
ncbi:hypothetical protein [Woodsholea maritima]|uniref:hypothetical protein n=1 Tax=Woodsholea maritima TaxID=240237 RepID=UPI0003A7ABAB|nr:hypothetical protein [Woodsholea maritima]